MNRNIRNGLLAVFVIVTGLSLGLGLAKIAARRRPLGARPPVMPAAQSQDLRSLKEKARGADYAEDRAPKKIAAFSDLAALAQNSSAVIVGVPQDNVSVLSSDGKSATIDYKVSVAYAYKSKLKAGDVVTVSLPGGRVSLDGGAVVEVRTPWLKKMMTGKTYVLFLSPGETAGHFVVTGESQGIFEIPTTKQDRKIQTHSGIPNDPVWKYNGMDVKSFLVELRRVTGKPLG
jgi:hypothetical protein